MTRERASSHADLELPRFPDDDETETTKVGDLGLSHAEAQHAAQLSKETRKATAFDLEAAMRKARRSTPDVGRSGRWPRGSQPSADEIEIPIEFSDEPSVTPALPSAIPAQWTVAVPPPVTAVPHPPGVPLFVRAAAIAVDGLLLVLVLLALAYELVR